MNKLAIQSIGMRVHDVAVTLAELVPAACAAGQVTPALEHLLGRISDLLSSTLKFTEVYGQRGFLSRCFRSHWDHVQVPRSDPTSQTCGIDCKYLYFRFVSIAARLMTFVSLVARSSQNCATRIVR